MSVSVHVYAMRDESQSQSYATVYRECVALGIEPPDAVMEFFGGVKPDADGAAAVSLFGSKAVKKWSQSQDAQGFIEVDLSMLPAGTKRLRFCMSF